jgi:glyoxylase-like metal-dependent hydrolase (beta-lactamase superfamily II)
MKIAPLRSLSLAVTALAVLAVSAGAQQRDFSQVQITTTKITNNFYALEGQGGRIGVLSGPDGVLMVDGQFAPLTEKIVAAIKQISPQPIRFLVNTHVHGDHTGGNENFAKMGVVIYSRPQLRDRLAHPRPNAQGNTPRPAPEMALPKVTYNERTTWHMNGEEVELIAIPRAHTDGDTMVRFPANDVIMTGDFYRSVAYPNIDRNNGGSLDGMLRGLGVVIGLAGPSTKILPGHGPIVDRNAVVAHRDMMLGVKDAVAKLIREGKSEQEVIAANPAGPFESKVAEPGTSRDRFVAQVYAELKASL